MAQNFRRTGALSHRSRGPFTPAQNLILRMDEMRLATKGVNTPYSSELEGANKPFDSAIVTVLADVPEWGLVAEYDEEGNPTTQVELVMPLPKGLTTATFKGRNLHGLSVQRSGGSAVTAGGFFAAERCYYDKTRNRVTGYYGSGGPSADEFARSSAEVFAGCLAAVLPERRARGEGNDVFQSIILLNDAGATELKSLDELVPLTEAIFPDDEQSREIRKGRPTFVFMAHKRAPANLSDEEKLNFASDIDTRMAVMCRLQGSKPIEGSDEREYLTPEQQVAAILADEGNKAILDLVSDPEWQVQVVPALTLTQAPMRLSENRRQEIIKRNEQEGRPNAEVYVADASENYAIRAPREDEDVTKNFGFETVDTGFRRSNLMAQKAVYWYDEENNQVRANAKGIIVDENGSPVLGENDQVRRATRYEMRGGISTYQNTTSSATPTYALMDIPTPITEPYHLAAINAMASEISQANTDYYTARREATEARRAEAEATAASPRP